MSPTPPADEPIEFHHVDVFTDHPFSGNGLIVMFCQTLSYSAGRLRTVTRRCASSKRSSSLPPTNPTL